MKFIDSSYEIIPQEPGLLGTYKQIEKAARTAYKSEDNITDDSAKKMVETLCKLNHGAALEHGTIYLKIPAVDLTIDQMTDYGDNPYSKFIFNEIEQCAFITTNARVIFENQWEDDLMYICEPTEFHEKRYTVKFTTSIGVCREILRHRKFSFLNESTRYVNYSKDKFGNELTCINPEWIKNFEPDSIQVRTWIDCLSNCEFTYMSLLESGLKPQDARGVIPLDVKSELIVTGFISDWVHFFRLRSHIAATGKPHPDIQKLADDLMQEFINKNYCNYEEIQRLENSESGESFVSMP